jgi:hypothetical protein
MASTIGLLAAIGVMAGALRGLWAGRRAMVRIASGRATLRDLARYTGIESRAAILHLREQGLDMRPVGVSGRDVLYMIDPAKAADLRTWFQRRIDTGPMRCVTAAVTLALCGAAGIGFAARHSWGWPFLGGAFWIQLAIVLARILYVDRKLGFSSWSAAVDEGPRVELTPAGFDAQPIVWQPFGPTPSADRKPQFRFLISGRHISGQGFYKTMYAVAHTRREAETYLRTFLNNRQEYVTWEIVEIAEAAQRVGEPDCVCDPGPITLLQPATLS